MQEPITLDGRHMLIVIGLFLVIAIAARYAPHDAPTRPAYSPHDTRMSDDDVRAMFGPRAEVVTLTPSDRAVIVNGLPVMLPN